MLMGMGDAWLDSIVAGTVTPPVGSPAANALVTSATPNPAPTAVSAMRTGFAPARALNNTPIDNAPANNVPLTTSVAPGATAVVVATTNYPLGLTGTEWLMILGASALLLYFLLGRKGGLK